MEPPPHPPQGWRRPKIPWLRTSTLQSNQVKCIFIVSLLSIMFICLVATIIWLSFLPTYMKYSIQQASIARHGLAANDTLNANFHFLLQANNPNSGFAVYYNEVYALVLYERTPLSENSPVPPFHQPSRNISNVGFDVMAKDVRIDETVARDLNAEWDSGVVALDLILKSKMVLRFGGFKIHRRLKVHCKGLNATFSSSKGFQKVACSKHVYD
ncbi:hypothetical protein F511_05241 [Dorcoceras hygrometricum]|uniref:Late embryogenesis abundant protein LEA-2 subgroup domain-containing protein n=1 Tax=Dorcoceras hygrometricum TaxID=472368 RepID=A0A2Z7CJC3_9LAMI|nr:hypothetical protein F511_05241 [Dorcoceras hygrometricum]